MNILFISPSYFPIRGGTEQVIHSLVSILNSTHNINVLTIRWYKKWKKYETINGIEVYRVGFLDIKGISLYLKYLSFFIAAFKLHKKYKFDLIHMFHVYEFGGTAYLLKKFFRIPLIITLAGWDTFDPVRNIPKRHIPFAKLAMNSADYITAPSYHLAEAGKKQGCKKEISVIPHGSSMHEKVNSKALEVKSVFNIQNKKLILSIQRLHSRKGLEYLINAIPIIIKHINDVSFVIGGTGPEEESLKNLVDKLELKNYVFFTGFISDEELPSYYASADLFALPTLYEAFGLVYIDALCFGIPIVTTVNGGSLDIINDKNGILVPPKDSNRLGKAIIEALNKKWDRGAIKEGAEKYRWDKIANDYKQLYLKTVTQG